MDVGNLTIGLAILAGMASFLSPCVLALVPAYVGYLGGRSVNSTGDVVVSRWETLTHGLAFVIGFSFIFVALGAVASALGSLLLGIREWLTRIGGVVVIIFGLHTMGVIRIPILDYDTRKHARPDPRWGYLSSVLMGIFFSAGWTPCVGPVLGAILTLAWNTARLQQGVLLLSAYSLGLAIPFLLAALGIGRVVEFMRRYRKLVYWISIATGAILVLIGIMLFTGTLEQLARFGFFVDFGL